MADTKNYNLSLFKRNRYFYAKLMTVRDFDVEQGYMNDKRHLLNRMVNGVGIICGLTPDDVAISNSGGNIKIKFITGGVAIDCFGREIVVPIEDSPRDIWIKQGSTSTALTADHLVNDTYYLYLEYDPREGEMVSSASENSSCDETCCPSRIIENFQVIASTTAPDILTIACQYFSGEATEDAARQKVKKWLVDQTSRLCSVPIEGKVFFLALRKGSALNIDQQKTAQYLTFVANNRALSELLACHISDFSNPHKTSAAQVGALKSVDGVESPGGNIDLVAANSVTITPNTGAKTITIGDPHSDISGNPHDTKHEDLLSVLPIFGDAYDEARNKHVSNDDAEKWNKAVLKVGGVQPNSMGEILIQAGTNITITTAGNAITITAAGGTSAPSARTGTASIPTNSDGMGSILVDPLLGHSNYCVVVGINHGEFSQFGVMQYSGYTLQFEVDVFRQGSNRNKFRIAINAPGFGARSVPIFWWAIPGEVVTTPTTTIPTITIPTVTYPTIPTLTIEPTLTFPTIPTLTIEPTLTFPTIPTLTIEPTLTFPTIPTLTIEPTLTFPTIPTLTIQPTFTPTLTIPTIPTLTIVPTLTIQPTITQTIPTFNPTLTMPTVITPGAGFLTDISGIGEVTADKLTAGGITTIAELAAASPEHVAEILGYSSTTKATTFIDEAKTLLGI